MSDSIEEKTAAAHMQAADDETGLNGTAINWRYWVEQISSLSAAHAACLMSALDPDKFATLSEHPGKDDPSRNIEKARKIQRLAESQGKLLASSTEWVKWAQALHINVHTGFLLAVWKLPDDSGNKDDAVIVAVGATAKHAWMTQAWGIGESWMLAEEKRTGVRPTVVQIAKHVEGELSNKVITGPRGRFLDWETIKKEALTGITGRTKGDNFKRAKGNPQRKKCAPIVKGQ